MKEAYFYGASGILAVVDRTNRASLDGIGEWFTVVREVAGPVPAVLAVNKNDLAAQAAFGTAETGEAARRLGCDVLLTSAKTGENVERAFERLGDLVVHRQLAL